MPQQDFEMPQLLDNDRGGLLVTFRFPGNKKPQIPRKTGLNTDEAANRIKAACAKILRDPIGSIYVQKLELRGG